MPNQWGKGKEEWTPVICLYSKRTYVYCQTQPSKDSVFAYPTPLIAVGIPHAIHMIFYCDFSARIDGYSGVVEEPRAEWTKARGSSLVDRDLMHLVGEDLRLQLGVFIAQGRKRLAHLHQLPPTFPFESLLLVLEAALLI